MITMKDFFRKYFEVLAFSAGLLLLALMNPEGNHSISFCLFDLIGIPYCPGEGLGHSISYFFRGHISSSLEANLLGPLAIFIIGRRIFHLLWKNHKHQQN